METKPQEGKSIGNVGVLDLRTATEVTVAGIRRIGNVGMVLVSPETAHLVARITMGNLGGTIEAPIEARLFSGQVIINRDFFRDQLEPLHLIVTGQLIIEPEVQAADLEKGLGSLHLSGQIYRPEHLSGALQAKVRTLQGQLQTYDGTLRLVLGDLLLDEHTLPALSEGSQFAVVGKLLVPKVVDNELLARKITKLHLIGSILCHEENAQVLFSRLDEKTGMAKKTIIPAGFELMESQLVIDADSLGNLPGKKLYCTKRVQIGRDVQAETLDQTLEQLIVKNMVLYPKPLAEVMNRKAELTGENGLAYEGELWLVEGEEELVSSRFEYLEGKATLVVLGALEIDPTIDAKILAERLAKVHLKGEISCTRAQMGAIQARLGLNKGELRDSAEGKEEEEAEEGIGNVGHLKL
ncbi:MAG: hypothetical protein EXS58_16615 [Candidatus Latescibacteria bacterium]|nr:hypothetical protein [Candidatus Latescibacterota bacterium]